MSTIDVDEPLGAIEATVTTDLATATRVDVPLGRRVMVVGDLLLVTESSPSSQALAADVARTLERWQGPGTVIICGNLFAGRCGGEPLDADLVRRALDAHRELTDAVRGFTGRPDCRLLVLPGWRDPEVATDPAVVTELYALGIEVTQAVDLHLVTAAGDRRVLVRPGHPVDGAPGIADAGTAEHRPWLAGIDRLEDPGASGRFVSSRTLYRRLGRFIWVPPLLAVVVALVIRLTVVFHGVYHLVHRASGPRHVLIRAYSASWPSRFLFTIVVVAGLELVLAAVVAVLSRRIWRAHGGGDLRPPWADRSLDAPGGAPPSSALTVGSLAALDEARALIAGGLTGLVTGGGLRAELAHLGPGFFACPGGTTELVREHRGRVGLPPVFLHHRQSSWVELETGADLHVRLLLADIDLPTSTTLERIATGYRVVKGRKPAADLHPALVASWPRGASWPAAPDVAANRVRVRRVRRLAAAAIFLAGLFDLLVAVSRPAAGHLHLVREYVPLGVSQAAGALVALAGIGLMMLARGVRRGQWRAWIVAVALLAATLVLHLAHGASLGGLLLTLFVLLFLLAERDLFRATADKSSVRSAVVTLVVGGVVAVGSATLAIELSSHLRAHQLPSWPVVLGAAAERLVGLQTVALPDTVDDWVSPSLLGVGIALAVVTIYLLTRPVVDRGLSGRHAKPGSTRYAGAVSARRAAELRARDIVRRHGTGTLDYFALRDDKQWFFHRDSLVAYAVYGGVCLVSPDPIGPHSERRHVWDAFRRLCDRNGWGVAVMAAAEEWLPAYRDAGMRHLYIGDEAVVDLRRFSLQGGRMKGLRQAVNRVARYGYTVQFLDPSQATPDVGGPLVELMGKNRRGDQERGFSMMLGRLFDQRDTGLLLTVVYGPDGQPAAMCQFVPSAAIRGFSLDLMRRDPGEHPNGLLDYALCSTIDHLRQRGQHGLSLNFAAMRSTLEGESGDGLTQRVERWALRRMSGVLPIESLWRFNAKYEPDWLPRYVVYDSAELFAPT
ncbi:MAG TPA: phosphatidylglycerol lysyltransferase domain-containing protein, partial [Acidimicrobiales bacterium]